MVFKDSPFQRITSRKKKKKNADRSRRMRLTSAKFVHSISNFCNLAKPMRLKSARPGFSRYVDIFDFLGVGRHRMEITKLMTCDWYDFFWAVKKVVVESCCQMSDLRAPPVFAQGSMIFVSVTTHKTGTPLLERVADAKCIQTTATFTFHIWTRWTCTVLHSSGQTFNLCRLCLPGGAPKGVLVGNLVGW